MSTRTESHRRVTAGAEEPGENRATGSLGALGLFSAIASIGLLLLAFGDNAARRGDAYADPFFWFGLVLIIAPIAARVASRSPDRAERLGLLVVLGTALYLMKLLHSPTQFTFHDELGHVRSTVDILQTGHLFTPNPLVGAYAVYPGTEIVVAALAKISGLSVFTSASLLIGLVRVSLLPALFLLYERVSGSARVAGIAALLYAANPNYLFFDAQFAYESLALPLAIFVIVTAVPSTDVRRFGRDAPWPIVAAVGLTVVVTHHLSSFAMVLFLLGLGAFGARGSHSLRQTVRSRAVALGLTCLVAVGGWITVAGSKTSRELLPVVQGTVKALGNLITGAAGPRKPFATDNGPSDSLLARLIGVAAVLLLLLGLAFGLRALWRRRRSLASPEAILGLAAVIYPASLVLRITDAGTETSNRASEFVFVGLGYLIALTITRRKAPSGDTTRARLDPRRLQLLRPAFPALATLLILGGLVVGWAPYARLPGRYAPGASSRSIDAPAVATARWVGSELPRRSVGASDGANSTLLIAYGRMDPQRGQINGVRVSEVFVSRFFGPTERKVIQGDKIRYLVVDQRLASGLPLSDRYFEGGDPPHFKPPVSVSALNKFDRARGLDRVFDTGPIQIYDAGRILDQERRR